MKRTKYCVSFSTWTCILSYNYQIYIKINFAYEYHSSVSKICSRLLRFPYIIYDLDAFTPDLRLAIFGFSILTNSYQGS